MIKKLIAVLLSFFLCIDFLVFHASAAEITAGNVTFIKAVKSNSGYNKSMNIVGAYAALKLQPDLNVFVEGILKIIYKIVPIQQADGTLKVSPKEMEERKAILRKKITFENDIRLFALYAFMNYTGYRGDNDTSEFTDIRNMLVEDLKRKNLKLSDNKYYINKDVQFSYYRNALRDMGSEPDFSIIGYRGNMPNNLSDLPEALKEFYSKADIEDLYNKYKPYYNSEIKKIEDKSLSSLVLINNYLKIDNEDIPNISVELNLLEACDKNAGFSLLDKYKGNAVITLGPTRDSNIKNVVHEYLHCIINPIVDNLEADVNKLSFKAKEIPEGSHARLYYKDWSSNVKESIIRSLEYRALGENRRASIQGAMNDGFILTQYFDEKFDKFKDYNGSLNDFIKSLLRALQK